MSDEHQARALSCAGHFVQTPNLDRLAARGVRFSNAYTPSPICVPARASFATGLYPHQTGHWENSMPYRGTPPSWGHWLQEKGIRVESIGKLHYRDPEDPVGFEAMHVPMMVKDGVGMVFASARKEEERVAAPGRMLGKYIGPGESTYTRYDQEVVAQTQDWLRGSAQSDQPWCLYVGLVAPHFPLVCPERFFEMYPPGTLPPVKAHPDTGYRRHPWVELQSAFDNSEAKFREEAERLDALSAYFGLISWLDYNVGLILTALDASGQMERTTIVYTSDHGDNAGARGMWGKSNMYQESAAVPLILAGPAVAAHGPGPVVCNTAVSLVDLTQTIQDHFDATSEEPAPGTSLYHLLNAPDPEREVFSEYHAAGAVSGAFMLRKGRWKLIEYLGFEPELFDLEADPDELLNRAADPDCAQILADLRQRLRAVCDPEAVDRQAHADQAALIAAFGGLDKAVRDTGSIATGGTPPPQV